MATRANIIITRSSTGELTQVYRHNDGYPGCTGKELKDICYWQDFDKEDIIDCLTGEYEIEGVREDLHFDIEYLYIIDTDARTLTAYEIDYDYPMKVEEIKKHYADKIDLI